MALFGGWLEAVTDPGLGADVAGLGGVFLDLFSKLADKNAEVFGLFGVVTAPNGRQNGPVCQDFAAIVEKEQEKIEFFWSEMDQHAPHPDFARRQVYVEITAV